MVEAVDSTDQPLKGVVLCCTSLTPDVRGKLAETAAQMGAIHKLDLTADVTHLLVGSITTPKYRYVAKDRPDILVLQPEFVEAVRSAWMEASEAVDMASLEAQYATPPFHGLRISITGFEDIEQRSEIEKTVVNNGGSYSGDMTKHTTHLIVASTKSQKYVHAKQWGINTVSYKWFRESLQRGMALDESLYAPELPIDQQGIGAFRDRSEATRTVLGKRACADEGDGNNNADEAGGRRKLRKAASMRLEGHSQGLWQDISAQEVQIDTSEMSAWDDERQSLNTTEGTAQLPRAGDGSGKSSDTATRAPVQAPKLFSSLAVRIHGFEPAKVKAIKRYLQAEGASIVESADERSSLSPDTHHLRHCSLVAHQTPENQLPEIESGSWLVTEWWVERCIHYRKMLDPQDDVLSRPLFKLPGFEGFTVSTSGFEGVTLRQTAEAVKIGGAVYQEKLLPTTSVLICSTQIVKKEKGYYASKHKIPVVSAEWLWASLKSRRPEALEPYLIDVSKYMLGGIAGDSSASNFKPTDDFGKVSVDQHPKRLSSTRQGQSTLLSLKSSKSALSRRQPFILDDHDDEDDPGDESLAIAVPVAKVHSPQQFPLREISPNMSQRNEEPTSSRKHFERPADGDTISQEKIAHGASVTAKQNLAKDEDGQSQLHARFTSDLETLLAQRHASRSASAELSKRKQRPLGRNVSWTSNPSASSERPSPALDPQDSASGPTDLNAMADGYSLSGDKATATTVPSGTQLGYEMEDAVEAHRRQMSKKIGCALLQDEGIANKRVARVITVKDSAMVAAREAKGTRRARQRR